MKFSTKTGAPQSLSTDALILGVFEQGAQPAATAAVDQAAKGLIGRLLKQGDFTGKPGSSLVVRHPEGIKATRLLLVGLGNADELDKGGAPCSPSICKDLSAPRSSVRTTTGLPFMALITLR